MPDLSTPSSPRLLDQVRRAIRVRHYSPKTEKTYLVWIHQFIFFHNKRHPNELGPGDVQAFLSSLAVERHLSPSSQNQALSNLLFLYRRVLHRDLGWIENIVRAKRSRRLPVVLSRDEVRSLLACMKDEPQLVVILLYGAGLRLRECCRLRVKDIDFGQNQIVVREGKGNKVLAFQGMGEQGDPPDAKYDWLAHGPTVIDMGEGASGHELPGLPDAPDGHKRAWVYLESQNSFLRFSSAEASFEWTGSAKTREGQ